MKRMSVLVWALGVILADIAPAFGDDTFRLVVDDDRLDCPNADFTSIQAAVDAAAPGATIQVCAGIYHERVTITKNRLRLLAKGPRGGAVVDGDMMGDCSSVASPCAGFWVLGVSGVRIEGFTVQEGHEADILLEEATKTRIRNNLTSTAGHDGIQVFNSHDNVIEDNVVFDNLAANACGINLIGGSARNVVRDNLAINNEWGIQIAGAPSNEISRNATIGNRGNGIRNIAGASGTLIKDNRAFSNGFAPNAATTGTTNSGIRIQSGTGIVVVRNHAFGNATVDVLSEVATATFDNNRCNTASSPELCERSGEDGDDGDDD